jgi:tripartite-type tricarboxylate transporter receptor subunit TctC
MAMTIRMWSVTAARRVIAMSIALLAFGAAAQKLDEPLRFVVGYAPGGASDRAARLVAEALHARYGTTVIVENKTGAGGRLAAQQFKNAAATDNVLMLGNPAIIVVAPLVFKDDNYDPNADFVPVTQVTSYEFGIAVGPQVPARDMKSLLAWLKANPDKAFFGVPATGSLPHFFALMLGDRAAVKAEVVGYKGSAPLATELIGGQVPVAVDTIDALAPLHQGKKLAILAVSGSARSEFVKDVPTLKESGIDLSATGWNTFFAPKAMPAAKVAALAQAIATAMSDPAVRKRFVDASMDPVSMTQEQTSASLKAYKAQWEPVVKRSGYQQ